MAATGTLAPSPVFTGFDSNGDPLASGKLTTYAAGTSTLLATYSEVTLTSANANPIVLDSAGRCVIFLSPASYKFVLTTSADAAVWTQDNIGAVPVTNVDLDIDGTAGTGLTAGDVVFSSAGDGSLTSGRWYKADADLVYASSGASAVGMMMADLSTGVSGSVRRGGRVTGLSGLTAGTIYYASATAGGLTATEPSNSRAVGFADSTTSLILFGETKRTSPYRVASFSATVGNTGTGEDTLAEFIAPAGALSADGMSYRGIFWGHTVSNANAKTLRARCIEGANDAIIASASLTASETGSWLLGFEVKRSSTTVALAAGQIVSGPLISQVTMSTTSVIKPTATMANAITLRVTGEATTTNDIIMEGGTITLVP